MEFRGENIAEKKPLMKIRGFGILLKDALGVGLAHTTGKDDHR